MAEVFTISGNVEKASDSRGPWGPLTFDVAEEVEADLGAVSVTIAAGATQSFSLNGVTDVDSLIIKTGQDLKLTIAIAGAVVTGLPIRNILVLQTAGITSVSLQNPGTADVLVTVCMTRQKT